MYETKSVEWGVRFAHTDEVVACGSEAEARLVAERRGGELVRREVFETSWANCEGAQDDDE